MVGNAGRCRSDDAAVTAGVEDSWGKITGWLAERLPAAVDELLKPATSVDLDAVESTVGAALPVDLRTWYRINNGIGHRGAFGRLLPPGYNPLPCAEIVKTWRQRKSIDSSLGFDVAAHHAQAAAPAGTAATQFLPSFVPFAEDGRGQSMVVDLRDGSARGSVSIWDPENGGLNTPLWPGVAAMLSDVAESLHTGRPALNGTTRHRPLRPGLADDRLAWT